MAELLVGSAAEGERPSGLKLSQCEGLPRIMLDSGRIPYQVFERMDFLWKASNCLRLASPAASRMYSDQLRKLCAQHEALSAGDGPLLPEWVSDSLCSSCGGVLTPGLNCRVRVRHRSLASPSVKRAKTSVEGKKEAKRLNQVVTTCLVCGGVNTRGGTERRAHDKKRRRRGGGEGRPHAAGFSGEDTEPRSGKKRTRVATHLRGNFIPLGEASSARTFTVTTPAPVKNRKPSRPGPPQPKSSGSREFGARRNEKDSGRGNTNCRSGKMEGGSRVGLTSRGGSDPTPPRAAGVSFTQEGKSGDETAGGSKLRRSIGGGRGRGRGSAIVASSAESTSGAARGGAAGPSGGGGNDDTEKEPQASPPALSLLERIRRDAKKKRRQDAAAAAAAAAAVGPNGQR